jgi:hypothetical protein
MKGARQRFRAMPLCPRAKPAQQQSGQQAAQGGQEQQAPMKLSQATQVLRQETANQHVRSVVQTPFHDDSTQAGHDTDQHGQQQQPQSAPSEFSGLRNLVGQIYLRLGPLSAAGR